MKVVYKYSARTSSSILAPATPSHLPAAQNMSVHLLVLYPLSVTPLYLRYVADAFNFAPHSVMSPDYTVVVLHKKKMAKY